MPSNISRTQAIGHSKQITGPAAVRELQFLYTIAGLLPPGSKWVELGRQRGRATFTIAAGLANGCTLISAEDYENYRWGYYGPQGVAATTLAFGFILEHIAFQRDAGLTLQTPEIDAVDLADAQADRSIDVLSFSWASHGIIARDLAAWRPKIKEGGLICGSGFTPDRPDFCAAVLAGLEGHQVFQHAHSTGTWQSRIYRVGIGAEYQDP